MILYRTLRFCFSLYLRIAHRLIIRGGERLPSDGPLIICANHTSYLDAMLVSLCSRREVRFLVTRDFYDNRLLGPVIRGAGGIPVTLNGKDAEGIKMALRFLKQGEIIGIFPEGRLSRSGLPSSVRPGAALLAALSGAPLVPITIAGAFFVYPRGQLLPRLGAIRVTVHPPLMVDTGRKRDREYLQMVTDRLMERIGRRVRGYYRALGSKRRSAVLSGR